MRNGTNRYNKFGFDDNFSLDATQTGIAPHSNEQIPQAHYSVLRNTTASSNKDKNVFTRHYKDITFDTLKERHDNFCFEKVLQTKNQVYNTMHFTGIIEKPNNPNLILFMKQANTDKLNQQFNNSKYQNMTDSASFYDAFQRQMNIGSNEKARPRIGGINGEGYEFTQGQLQRDRTATSDDVYNMMSASDHRSMKLGSGKQSIMQQSAIGSMNGAYYGGQNKPDVESDLHQEFNRHFCNRTRGKTPQNHHDFLEVIKNQRSSIEGRSVSNYNGLNSRRGQDGQGAADHLLAVNRIERAHRTYKNMKLNSITIPAKSKSFVNNEALAEKGRQRQKHKQELDRQKQIEWVQGLKTAQGPSSPLRTRDKKFNNQFKQRVFPERHIFVILDGQDLNEINKELKFAYLEINTRLCKTIPQKIWDSKQAQRMDMYHRCDLSKPSKLMMKQLILEVIDEVNTKCKLDKSPMTYCWQLDGTRIKSLMEIHQQCRVLVLSRTKDFVGLKGLERLEGYELMQLEAAKKVKPKPATWIQTAAVSWLNKNDTLDMTNQMEASNSYNKADSTEIVNLQDQSKMIDAIRNEHARVYMQDQALLQRIKMEQAQAGPMHILTNQSVTNVDVKSDIQKVNKTGLAQSYDNRSVVTAEPELGQQILERQNSDGEQNTDGQIVQEEVQEEEMIQQTSFMEPERMGSKDLLAPQKALIMLRQKEPIYQIKPLALIEQSLAYDYKELEDSLINFLLEKVVVMREVPFVRAIEQLERNQNVNKIYDQISKVTGVGGFAGRQNTKKFQMAMANREQYQQTQPYEGPPSGLNNSDAGSDNFAQNRAGRATFKIKQDDGKDSNSGQPEGGDKDKVAQSGRMLRNEEIKEICEKHALKRNEVYQIRSQFASMCTMSDQYMEQLAKEKEMEGMPDQYQKKQMKTPRSYLKPQGTTQQSTHTGEPKEEGISIEYFIKFCSFLSGSLPHINKRILVAQGIDVQNQNCQVNWQTYLDLYCIFEAGQVQLSHLIRFWIKFFDQSLSGKCPQEEYLALLEELVRGVSLPKPNQTTKLFARMFQKQMERQKCLDENGAIITDKLHAAFEEGRLDIQLLCSALGRQALDESFLNEMVDFEDV